MSRTWFITGCSTGFGRRLTEKAHARGDRVVATARRVETLADLGTNDEGRILRLPLDVRKPEQITAAVSKARESFGEIDILVNNAGYGYFAVQEEGSLDQIREMYDTNVFGLISMTQAVLPHMRERKSGAIINLSSIAGWIGSPSSGFYQSSKWAVEALSEALHHEVSSFGIRVVSIQPGLFGTQFATSARRQDAAENEENSPYDELRELWRGNFGSKVFNEIQDAELVVDEILSAADSNQPFLRVPVGNDTKLLVNKRAELGDAEFVSWLDAELHEPLP